ncbi:hypothetical protein N7444_008212 [Penicillium canescens]|nr:hypothetical protein N7444_008212 [Penicillium canescens]
METHCCVCLSCGTCSWPAEILSSISWKGPLFDTSLFPRRIVLWFFFMVIIQNCSSLRRLAGTGLSCGHFKTCQDMEVTTAGSYPFRLSVGTALGANLVGTSNIGFYLPWTSCLTSGASPRCSGSGWGSDEIQQSYQSLRLSVYRTICARGFAPNNVGPAGISPDGRSSTDKVANVGSGPPFSSSFWPGQ